MHRAAESLHRKFNMLARKKVPTRDPCCPPAVHRAKSIRYAITERSDLGVGEDAEDVAHDLFNDANPESDDMTPLSIMADACGDERTAENSATAPYW